MRMIARRSHLVQCGRIFGRLIGMNKEVKRIYLDHAAATPLDPHVREKMAPFLELEFGNPSGLHQEGVRARRAIEEARETVATLSGAHASEIIFTGSGTESTNLAIDGVVGSYRASHPGVIPHIVTTSIEHHAVLEPIRRLVKERKVTVDVLPVDVEGRVHSDQVMKVLRPETALVAVMYANNEIGSIQPIAEIAKGIRKWKKAHGAPSRERTESTLPSYPYFFTDACQVANYCAIQVEQLGVDLMAVNSSKIYGPKGVGLLFMRRGAMLLPQIIGGGQEGGMRAGTENVAGIVGFAEAFRVASESHEEESARLTLLRDEFARLILGRIPGAVVNGGMKERLPNNLNVTIPEADHEFLAIALDARGVACSTKSACNELDAEISHVLQALRDAGDGASSSPAAGLRFSLGRSTTREDMLMTVEILGDVVETLVVPTRSSA